MEFILQKPQPIYVWPAPSLPCNLQSLEHVSNVFQISSTFEFYLHVKRFCLNVRRAAPFEKWRSSWGREGMRGLLYLASPWKQLSQVLRSVNYETTTAPWWVSQTTWLPGWKMLQPWLFGQAAPQLGSKGLTPATQSWAPQSTGSTLLPFTAFPVPPATIFLKQQGFKAGLRKDVVFMWFLNMDTSSVKDQM